MKRLHLTETMLDEWWRHNGIYDRMQASGILSNTTSDWTDADTQEYLQVTDDWWYSRAYKEKVEIYEDFFSEV